MCIRAASRGDQEFVTAGDDEKRAENEAAFRDANERIRAAEPELDPPLVRVPYLCVVEEHERYLVDPRRATG